MNLKEFLMPTWKKLLIWIVLSLVFSYILTNWWVSKEYGNTLCGGALCVPDQSFVLLTLQTSILDYFTLGQMNIATIDGATIGINFGTATPLIFMAFHVIIYLIACSVVTLYNKSKR